jgi:hypothetical protein
MKFAALVSGLSLGTALAAFALTGSISVHVGVEPLYALLRGIAAFLGVLLAARCVAGIFDAMEFDEASPDSVFGESGSPERENPS